MTDLMLLTQRQEDILMVLILGVIGIVAIGGFLYLAGMFLLGTGFVLWGAYRNIKITVLAYLIGFGAISGIVWFFEGGKDKYGWASFLALVAAIIVTGFLTAADQA